MWAIVQKEYRQRARGNATVGLIVFYTLVISAIGYIVYITSYSAMATRLTSAATVGTSLGVATFITQMIMALMLSLSYNAASIAAEKDQQTFELLNLTLFRSWEIIFGKYVSTLGFLMVLVITALPLYALAFSFGGLQVSDLGRLAGIVIGTTMLVSSVGLLFSLTSDDLRTALGRSFLSLTLAGAVTGLFGGLLYGSLDNSPPNPVVYWGGALSWLINPLWAVIDSFWRIEPHLSWSKPQPLVVPGILHSGALWIYLLAAQMALSALILLFTSALYPRYRSSRSGDAA